ncbi:hypothetical protein DPMN_074118 [Dreissena polymorpha]|uniref:Uncharacterized protein n=2 Tax=Dreissena polymorpha TaxID=45954 RepID=A0A9D3YEM7_DREPO|nr:hypothetical protein DPMN_074118 [Dreissena polymorpha]
MCVAINPGSSHKDNSSTKLVVNYAPDVTIYMSSTNPSEGQPFELKCEASGVPALYTFTALTQTHGGTQIPNTHITLEGPASMSSRIVRIPTLRMDDTGTYTCSVQNGVRNVSGHLHQTAATKLMVKVSPKILTPSLKIAAATGTNTSLSVPVYAYPTLDEIALQRYDGLNISRTSEKHILLWNNTTVAADWYGTKVQVDGNLMNFTIIDLQPADFGNYTITMKNAVNVSSAVFTVVAETKPEPVTELDYHQHTLTTDSVVVTWSPGFGGGLLQIFNVLLKRTTDTDWSLAITTSEYNITLKNLQPGNEYMVKVYASNLMGNSTDSSTITFITQNINEVSSEVSSPIAGIVGGVVGGTLCLIAAIVAVIIVFRKYHITCAFAVERKDTRTDKTCNLYETSTNRLDMTDHLYSGVQGLHTDNDTAHGTVVYENTSITPTADQYELLGATGTTNREDHVHDPLRSTYSTLGESRHREPEKQSQSQNEYMNTLVR